MIRSEYQQRMRNLLDQHQDVPVQLPLLLGMPPKRYQPYDELWLKQKYSYDMARGFR